MSLPCALLTALVERPGLDERDGIEILGDALKLLEQPVDGRGVPSAKVIG